MHPPDFVDSVEAPSRPASPVLDERARTDAVPDPIQREREMSPMIDEEILERFHVKPGTRVRLTDHDTGWKQSEELKD